MLAVLELVDAVMIANLLIMVIIGRATRPVVSAASTSEPPRPARVGSRTSTPASLTLKLAMAIVGISVDPPSLARQFINAASAGHSDSMLWRDGPIHAKRLSSLGAAPWPQSTGVLTSPTSAAEKVLETDQPTATTPAR